MSSNQAVEALVGVSTNVCLTPYCRRFGLPQPPPTFTTTQPATAYGPACPQQPFQLNTIPIDMSPRKRQILQDSEDCLFINVLRPAGIKANAGLPVLFVS